MTSAEFAYLTNIGYTGTLADKRQAYFNDLIAGNVVGWADADIPVAGEFVPDIERWSSGATVTAASQAMLLSFFTAKRTETISTLSVTVGGTAAAATPSLVRFGIYSVASNGDLTLTASTANDTTLLAATNTTYNKALSSSFSKVAGRRYATAVLVVSATTMPIYVGQTVYNASPVNTLLAVSPRRTATLAGQSDLPASISSGSLATTAYKVGMRLS